MRLQGKKVLVTGGAGFIGSTLVRELLNEKADIIVYDNFSSGRMENISEVNDQITVHQGDIRNADLEKVMEHFAIDYVFNLAAMPYIPECYDKPGAFFDINASGALNVMLSAKRANVKRIVQYSTSEVYGTGREIPMNEDHRLHPQSTYAVSKLAADRLCFTLHHEQQLPIVILRQFNVYGPRETHPYIIPELISQLSKGNKLTLGNVNATRDFTYVSDAARAAIELSLCKEAEGEVVNSGYGMDYSIADIAKSIGKIMGHSSVDITVEQKRLRPLDVERLCADHSKLHRLTGWKPTITLEEGLKKTVDWFNANGKQWPWDVVENKSRVHMNDSQ